MSGGRGSRGSYPALRARGITKSFVDGDRETMVLKGIDLDLRAGELVSLMGPSGSGKSTLLTILGTLLRPTSGKVEIAGREVTTLPEKELTRFRNRSLGFIFQFHHLLPDFTALENVLLPAYARSGHGDREATRRAHELLERIELADRHGYRPGQLSGGQRQRVAIARALLLRPALVLADEPTGSLDRESGKAVIRLLRELAESEGIALLISTHDPEVAKVSDRTIRILDGRVEGRAGVT